MRLELESGVVSGPIDDLAIERALGRLGPEESFAILSRTPADQDNYVQTQFDGNGFAVEKRGHAGAHFTAMRLTSRAAPQRQRKWWQLWKAAPKQDGFTRAEMTEIFRSYVEGSEPTFWKWVPLEFSE